jgi:hypothetical protein
MKKILTIIPTVALIVGLSSCGKPIDYKENLDDYIYSMKFHEDFNILQLADIHWNYNTSTSESKDYLDNLFEIVDSHVKEQQGKDAKIDLIEITGDQFMLANAYHVKSFIKYFEEKAEEYGFMYTVIWGNHDRQGLYNPNWMGRQFAKAEHCIYIELEDNLYGRSNFVINLTEDGKQDSKTVWQIANLDSGVSFSESALDPFRDYDYIREEQVDWWKRVHDISDNAPTIAYYHIPQQESKQAWLAVTEEGADYKNKFFKLEGFGDNGEEEYASSFVEVGRENNLRAVFSGHAHNVDWTVDYDGVILGLGVKTGTELYYKHIDVNSTKKEMQMGLESVGINENFDLVGASLVTIKDGENFDIEHVYYNERGVNDFVRWVKW